MSVDQHGGVGGHRLAAPSGTLDQGDLRASSGSAATPCARALRREGPPAYRRPAAPGKLDPYKDYLLARLAEFPELSAPPRSSRRSAPRATRGGISILKDFTRPYRERRREPVVRFETPPGRQAQVDWAELGRHQLRRRGADPAPVRHGPRLLAARSTPRP